MSPDLAARDTGLVSVDSLLPSDVGLVDRGVELARLGVLGESEGKVGGMAARIRPAAKTQPPTACRISESPVRLPVMKTLGATSSEDSAFARSVRPEIWVVGAESMGVGDRISACREGERKSIVPRRPTTYSRPPIS